MQLSSPQIIPPSRSDSRAPTIVSRADHPISRQNIDADALRVLYRLKDHRYTAYLVGGSVRDLLLGRRPKDFDVGTSAHPYEIKRLFRNCWIIGRRFRLAHVRFGSKVVEVATFRRQVPAGTESEPPLQETHEAPATPPAESPRHRHHEFERDNTFGTPEEDAFRRDFTINALFYDIATFSVIDYVGGLQDLEARLIRCIGDPDERFVEDPVRMLRAIALASRLDFRIDAPTYAAILRHRAEIGRSAPARLLEELYKILRSGASARTFRGLAEAGVLEHIAAELHRHPPDRLWQSLRQLDAYRVRFDEIPASLTNPILLGSLVVPLGMIETAPVRRDRAVHADRRDVAVGGLPLARRDVERLVRVIALSCRMHDAGLPPRAQDRLIFSSDFREALTWLEIHGTSHERVQHWQLMAAEGTVVPPGGPQHRRSRRRRRRRRRRGPHVPPVA